MNKLVYLGLSILEISKTLICEFWYDNPKPKYWEKSKLFYMDTDSIIIYIEIEDIYSEIIKDIKKRFDTSSYDLHRPLPKRKKKKCNWINERWIRYKNHDRISWIKSKNT